MSLPSRLPETVLKLLPYLDRDTPVWLVGGGVRDHLLGRYTVDLDFAVDGDALHMARHLADRLGGYYYVLDKQRGTGRVILEGEPGQRRRLDFACLRGPDINSDLRSRDFTINAFAVNLRDPEQWFDPTGGSDDLKQKILRTCSPNAVADDPVRALRAVRLTTELDLRMEPDTILQVQQAGPGLGRISPERVRDELLRILDVHRPGRALRLMMRLNLLFVVFPELADLKGLKQPSPHVYEALEHTLVVVDRLGDLLSMLEVECDPETEIDLMMAHAVRGLGRFFEQVNNHLNRTLSYGRRVRQLLFFASLYHDAGKATVRSRSTNGHATFQGHENVGAELVEARATTLRMSNSEVRRLGQIVRHHVRLKALERSPTVTPRAIYRFYRQAGESGVEAILLSLADLLGTYASLVPQDAWESRVEVASTLLEAFFEAREERIDPPSLMRGDELIQAMGLTPGPKIGQLLEIIQEAQVAGEVTSSEEALALARRVMDEGLESNNLSDTDEELCDGE